MREFRVKKLVRYIVTDWEDYRGTGRVEEVTGPCTLDQANRIAAMLGAQHPGSIVNPMEPEPQSYGIPTACGSEDPSLAGALQGLPYPLAAAIRRDARANDDAEMLARLNRLGVAVDA